MKIAPVFCVALVFLVMARGGAFGTGNNSQCKELNQINCYAGKNEGIPCSSKNPTKSEPRWWYSGGSCRKFSYRGCNGNRNRFCTKESCIRRCGRE